MRRKDFFTELEDNHDRFKRTSKVLDTSFKVILALVLLSFVVVAVGWGVMVWHLPQILGGVKHFLVANGVKGL